MKKLEITILTENVAGGKFLAEHGLSYLINIDNELVLFDTGHSDVFLKNANALGFDIHNNVTKVVLSHGHWDHGDGLRFIANKTLIAHPGSFVKRYRKANGTTVGLTLSKKEINEKFTLIESKNSYKVSANLFFLGEIPRTNSFESKTTTFELENGEEDFIPDDSALAAVVNNELVVITGCSHSGICNICEHAKKITGINKIAAVIGGFHLKHQNNQTKKTVEYFKSNGVKRLLPSHCTELPALTLFYETFKTEQVKTGVKFQF